MLIWSNVGTQYGEMDLHSYKEKRKSKGPPIIIAPSTFELKAHTSELQTKCSYHMVMKVLKNLALILT